MGYFHLSEKVGGKSGTVNGKSEVLKTGKIPTLSLSLCHVVSEFYAVRRGRLNAPDRQKVAQEEIRRNII